METPVLDGPTPSPESADSKLNDTPPEAAAAAEDESNLPDKDVLRVMGYTKKTAARLLANGKSPKYLNTRITCKVLMVHQANNVEQIQAAQKMANKLGKDPTVDARTRAACLTVVTQAGMALARLSEVAIATARNLDMPEDEGEKQPVKATQNNYYGFPPVSDGSERRVATTAKSGGEKFTNIAADVKSE